MSDTTSKGNHPKTFIKRKEGAQVGFRSPSRFSGGGLANAAGSKSQYKPMPVRITQHKG